MLNKAQLEASLQPLFTYSSCEPVPCYNESWHREVGEWASENWVSTTEYWVSTNVIIILFIVTLSQVISLEQISNTHSVTTHTRATVFDSV